MLGRESVTLLAVGGSLVLVWVGAIARVQMWWCAVKRAPVEWTVHPELRDTLVKRPELPRIGRLRLAEGHVAWWAVSVVVVSAWCAASPPYDPVEFEVGGGVALAVAWAWQTRSRGLAFWDELLLRERLPPYPRNVAVSVGTYLATLLWCSGYVLGCVFVGRAIAALFD